MRLERLPSGEAGVRYTLDGEPAGADELVRGVRVNPGQHVLRAEAPGWRPLKAAFRADERDRLVVALAGHFEPLGPPPTPTPAPPPGTSAEAKSAEG